MLDRIFFVNELYLVILVSVRMFLNCFDFVGSFFFIMGGINGGINLYFYLFSVE